VAGANTTLTVEGTFDGEGILTVTGAAKATGSGSIVIGSSSNKVTLAKAMLAGGSDTGADGKLTLVNTNTLVLTDGGTIVVAGAGDVGLVNTTFGAGTYTAAGVVTISSLTNGDTTVTGATAGNGRILGASDGTANTVSLLTLGEGAATYTLAKAGGIKLALGNGATAIKVNDGSNADVSSFEASAKANIALGTSGGYDWDVFEYVRPAYY
jgi:hypothetical protein